MPPNREALLNEYRRRELWKRGDIECLIFHDGQKRINEMFERLPGSVIVLNISRQWGKTVFAVVKSISTAIKKKGSRIRIGAAFETDLGEFIEPAFEFILSTCPPAQRPKYNTQKKRYTFPNGSTIKCVGLDRKPNGLRGNTIDLIILDEAGFINRLNYLYESVIVPLTTHRPEARIIIQSTPPESPDHEYWDFVDRAKLAGAYAEFTIDENPMLTKHDVARLEKQLGGRHTTAFKREYLCKRIVEAERAIVPEWKPDEHRLPASFNPHTDDKLYQFWHKYEALDIGVQQDKTVCLFGYYNFHQQRLYIMDEVDVSGGLTTTDLIYQTIVDKEGAIEYDAVYRRIADNSHPLLINDLASEGLVFTQTDKEKIHEMVGKVKVWVRQGRVVVHPRCKQLIGCLESGIWDKQRTKFERSKVFGHYDALAALVYLIRNCDEWTDPVPDYIVNPNGWPVPGMKKGDKLSPLGQDLRKAFK